MPEDKMATPNIHPGPADNGPSSSTGSSPPPPRALLASSADLSPGIPVTTPPVPPSLDDLSSNDQRTPRARQSSTSRLVPPERRPSRPTSASSFISTSSHLSLASSLHSPLCTPKVRDYAYPRTHKYHAPSFTTRTYSISSRSSTSSDIDSFFPSRIGGQLYVSEDDSWRRDTEEEAFEVDGEDEELVERRAVCVFDFSAECEGEISIEIGQVVWVEYRKGVSGWLVVRDEITENKGLVPEGYVRFLNGDEERQYLDQSPPTNTLLPRIMGSGEETPTQTQPQPKQQWTTDVTDDDDWIDEPEGINKNVEWNVDTVERGVGNVSVE